MFKPLNNRALIRPDEKETVTASGFILTDSSVEKPSTGTVLVGNSIVKDGDRVLFSKYGFDEVEIDKEKLYVVSENCILGIF